VTGPPYRLHLSWRWYRETVPCPHCGAEAGRRCRYRNGHTHGSVHGARAEAWAAKIDRTLRVVPAPP
jgi:hypothetical protein